MSQIQRITISVNQIQDEQILLTSEQQHYLLRVLRLGNGEKFLAMDGKGMCWLVKLVGEQGKILEVVKGDTELPIAVTLILALPKGNNFDDVVRYCTELGVAKIIPVLSDRTLLQPSMQKLERWRKISQEAAEQSERMIVPIIGEPVKFTESWKLLTTEDKFICEGRGDYPHLLNSWENSSGNDLAIAIGPEGGWTDTELQLAVAAGFKPVSIGKQIFRAVTAPIVTLSMISGQLNR
ncbi:16S rRNA (uracil(1498)-N(3))-methyltransferase [Calothrix sp. PCC 6303]|uniref:16S rRNA (uracil(1498)-N(3))-methyltransferase n=1 Tax=Calothrix sp. PCC 6303 TaxID=1170562 RepID=UPI0002A03CEA|nr:16S rRNA (uracil(1498)-N(3))-methyltransferase [Calothrix sp. PCC 6303]AFZ03585.1 Ribosomal RNA small subunit methyltransferase E [Calothrix sp. PCC 6303]